MNFVNILTILGVFTLIIIIYYWLRRYYDNKKKEAIKNNQFPSNSYMNAIGSRCPDGWKYTADGQCVNIYNIPVTHTNNKFIGDNKKSTNCNQTSVSFNQPNNWPSSVFEQQQYLDEHKGRCNWITSCGGAWAGLYDKCT